MLKHGIAMITFPYGMALTAMPLAYNVVHQIAFAVPLLAAPDITGLNDPDPQAEYGNFGNLIIGTVIGMIVSFQIIYVTYYQTLLDEYYLSIGEEMKGDETFPRVPAFQTTSLSHITAQEHPPMESLAAEAVLEEELQVVAEPMAEPAVTEDTADSEQSSAEVELEEELQVVTEPAVTEDRADMTADSEQRSAEVELEGELQVATEPAVIEDTASSPASARPECPQNSV